MTIKIVYDYQIFSSQKYGGVSRYFHEISSRISKLPDRKVEIVSPLYINEYFSSYSSSSQLVKGIKVKDIPKTWSIRQRVNKEISNLMISLSEPDIIHETYYTLQYIGSKKKKRVITVYDMIYEKFSSSLDPNNIFVHIKAEAIKRADHIICISENTRKDLIEILGVDEKKVSTTYLAYTPNHNLNEGVGKIPQIHKPFLLYVGERANYKNFDGLLDAYYSSCKLRKDFQIVCFGGGGFSSLEVEKIKDFQLQGQVIQIAGDDNVLAHLYRQAAAFVYPSLYEGFGIPPLEAMSFDCPVVCSNVSSIPEVVGDAGEYFDPSDLDSIVDAIEKVVYSEILSDNFKQLGRNRIKLFSWDLCAEKTNEIYQSLL